MPNNRIRYLQIPKRCRVEFHSPLSLQWHFQWSLSVWYRDFKKNALCFLWSVKLAVIYLLKTNQKIFTCVQSKQQRQLACSLLAMNQPSVFCVNLTSMILYQKILPHSFTLEMPWHISLSATPVQGQLRKASKVALLYCVYYCHWIALWLHRKQLCFP